MMKVFLLSRRGVAISKVRSDFEKGLAMDPAPYGFDAAQNRPGVLIEYSDGAPAESLFSKLSWRRLGFDLPHALRNLRAMRRADIIWTVIEWEWLAASFLQRIWLLQKKPIIGSCVFLAEDYPSYGPFRSRLWSWLMTKTVYLAMHSQRAIGRIKPVLANKVFHLLTFGISTRAFPVTPPVLRDPGGAARPIRIYSIGDDGRRDWNTLLAAFGNDPRFEITITCRWLEAQLTQSYSNLRIPSNVTVDDQRSFYEWADAVVVPMKENAYSGITVICEAVAMGKPVIASRTGGADTYFDESEIIYVPVGEASAMRDAVLNTGVEEMLARARRAHARFAAEDYSAAGMVDRYMAISRALLGGDVDGALATVEGSHSGALSRLSLPKPSDRQPTRKVSDLR